MSAVGANSFDAFPPSTYQRSLANADRHEARCARLWGSALIHREAGFALLDFRYRQRYLDMGGADITYFSPKSGADITYQGGADITGITFMSPCSASDMGTFHSLSELALDPLLSEAQKGRVIVLGGFLRL